MGFEEIGRQLERQGRTADIKRLAESEDGKKLRQMVDTGKLKEAAQSGDSKALHELLSGVLRTEEGKRLAESIKKLLN